MPLLLSMRSSAVVVTVATACASILIWTGLITILYLVSTPPAIQAQLGPAQLAPTYWCTPLLRYPRRRAAQARQHMRALLNHILRRRCNRSRRPCCGRNRPCCPRTRARCPSCWATACAVLGARAPSCTRHRTSWPAGPPRRSDSDLPFRHERPLAGCGAAWRCAA